jgi:hypothetical protein
MNIKTSGGSWVSAKDRQPRFYGLYLVWMLGDDGARPPEWMAQGDDRLGHFGEIWWYPENCPDSSVKKAHWENNFPAQYWYELFSTPAGGCTNLGPMYDPDENVEQTNTVDCLTRKAPLDERCPNCALRRMAEYEKAVDKFAAKMVRELMANDARGNFMDWDGHWSSVLSEIRIHVNRLAEKISDAPGLHDDADRERVTELCADTANFLMKMEDRNGEDSK